MIISALKVNMTLFFTADQTYFPTVWPRLCSSKENSKHLWRYVGRSEASILWLTRTMTCIWWLQCNARVRKCLCRWRLEVTIFARQSTCNKQSIPKQETSSPIPTNIFETNKKTLVGPMVKIQQHFTNTMALSLYLCYLKCCIFWNFTFDPEGHCKYLLYNETTRPNRKNKSNRVNTSNYGRHD